MRVLCQSINFAPLAYVVVGADSLMLISHERRTLSYSNTEYFHPVYKTCFPRKVQGTPKITCIHTIHKAEAERESTYIQAVCNASKEVGSGNRCFMYGGNRIEINRIEISF